jgi:GNAT superfamily N-acetyltransferase
MPTDLRVREARTTDEPTLRLLIPRSARALSVGFYSGREAEAAIRYVFGVDSVLIADGTYFVAEIGDVIVGCGGWSKRATLYGGDQHKTIDDPLLDPRTDAARIRAFFVAPEFARQGVGARLMQACARAAFDAGFRRLELMATLPGVPLYRAFGFSALEEVVELTPGGVAVRFVRMQRALLVPGPLPER